MADQVITPAELRDRLRVSRNTAYSLIASGAIRSVRLGDSPNAPIRITETAFADFIAGRSASLVASAGSTETD